MVKHRSLKRGLTLVCLLAVPKLLPAQQPTPTVSSLQSGVGSPTNGSAITAGTQQSVIQLFINGNFNPEAAQESVTWTENSVATPLVVIGTGTSQLVANVPQALYNSAGSAAITVTETLFATNGISNSSTCPANSANCTFTINPAMSSLGALANGIVGVSYSQPFFAGGTGPFTVQFGSNAAPPGLAATAGTGNPLAGTPTTAGNYVVNPTITDSWGNVLVPSDSLTIYNQLSITTTSLPSGVATHPYSATVSATGGATPYAWSATGLPAGLSINAGSGVISGTTNSNGTFPVTINVADSSSQSAKMVYSLNIAPLLTITTASLPPGVAQKAYSATVAASGGTMPYTWSATGLPSNLTITANNGAISGTPANSGTYSVTVTVSDSGGQSAQTTYSLQINSVLTITTNSLPSGVAAHAYNATVSATGGVSPYAWSATGLPSNLTINASNGAISGTPANSGTYSVTVTVSDSGGQSAQATYSLQINSGLTITTASLPPGVAGTAYNTTVSAAGGVTPYSWSATGLPSNLTINASNGAISGTPANSGTYSVTVTVSDSSGQNAQATYSLQINSVLTITTNSLPAGVAAHAYSATVSAAGGVIPYTWSATGLPANLTINASSGAISGTPANSGTYSVTVTVSDSSSQSAQATYSLQINSGLTITTASLPSGIATRAYSTTVSAAGGVTPYTWSAAGLPGGLGINPSSGAISGTPTSAGTFSVTVNVADSSTQNARMVYSLVITPSLTITTTGLPAGTVSQAYSGAVSVTGGVSPYTWSATGLPANLNINPNSGVISGTPTSAGTYPVTVFVSDSGGQTAQAGYSLLINAPAPPPLQISTQSLPGGTVGQIYVTLITAQGGSGNYTFSVSSGSLPPAVQLATAGQMYGIPTTPGTFSFTAVVTDSAQNTASRGFSIQILPATLTLTGSVPATVALNSTVSAKFGATGGVAPYSFALSGTPPTGTSFSGGTLAGTATAPGTFSFTITVSDSQSPPATASQGFTITVAPAPLVISAALPAGQVGQTYTGQFTATGGVGPYTWSGSAGGGLSVSSSGAVTGTPTAPETVSISVTVTDQSGTKASGTYSLTVTGQALTVVTANLPNGALTSPYSASVTASGGTPPYTFIAGGLPSGLTISSSGAISGTPIALGAFTVNVTVTDASGLTATSGLSLTISPAPLKITTTGVSAPVLGTSFSVGFGATGGTPPYTWTATGLPAGVTLASDGTLSGTPSALGNSSVTVTVTDANKQTASETINLPVILPSAPGVNFSGLPTTGTAGGQATTPITFNGVYPVDVTVKLTLTFAPAAGADDPNIQFSTGGRTASVTVKAGSTTSLTSVGVQTGTVAGVITVTAQLIAANGTDITPVPAPTRTITIAPSAPSISSVTATTNSTGFTVTVVGFDPTRAITQVTFTFTPVAGSTLQTTTVTVSAQTLFSAWYQSAASAQYGSQFSFTMPFTVSGNVSGIASVTVTLTNATGTSSSMTAPV